jgi:hypothetical protein
VEEVWEVLAAGGLPERSVRTEPRGGIDAASLRAAVAEVAAQSGEIDPWHVEPLLAWLRGFKHHWPGSFTSILGPAGEECLARLSRLPADPNRYLWDGEGDDEERSQRSSASLRTAFEGVRPPHSCLLVHAGKINELQIK